MQQRHLLSVRVLLSLIVFMGLSITSVSQAKHISRKSLRSQKHLRPSISDSKEAGLSYWTSGQTRFIRSLAAQTGLNPSVVAGWVLAEESGGAAKARESQGNHNWLNIAYFDSGPGSITKDLVWKNPESAAAATAQFLQGKKFGASQGIQNILKYVHGSADAQIHAIASSGWASSGYNGGNDLRSLYKTALGTFGDTVASAGAPAPKAAPQTINQAQAAPTPTAPGTSVQGTDPRMIALQTLMAKNAAGTSAFKQANPLETVMMYQNMMSKPPDTVPIAQGKSGMTVVADTPGVASSTAQKLIAEAEKWKGTPYSWGGGTTSGPGYGIDQGANTKGFDCSSFIQYLYAKVGINLPRVTYAQVKVGKTVSMGNLQPGDVVFFGHGSEGPHHVGMYIGGGQFIHAPHTGDVIKISSLSDDYYKREFDVAKRLI